MLRQALDEAEHHEKEQQERYSRLQQQEEANNVAKNTTATAAITATTAATTERSALIQPPTDHQYGAIASVSRDSSDLEVDAEYDDDDDDDDDDDEYLSETTDDEWESERESTSLTERMKRRGRNLVIRVWKLTKGCFTFVVNVENVWDSPAPIGGQGGRFSSSRSVGRRKKYVIIFWFVVLASAYTTERVSYKLLVDQSGPFRLLAVQMVVFAHAVLAGLGMLLSAISRRDFAMLPLGIPVVDVGLMALIDTIQMLLVFLTGYHVAPTLIVILIQFTIPLTALMSQFVHPDGYFKTWCGRGQQRPGDHGQNHETGEGIPAEPPNITTTTTTTSERSSCNNNNVGQPLPGWGGLSIEHISGSILISLAVLLALFPSIYTLVDEDFFRYAYASPTEIPTQTAFNTILFVSSCVPAAASQLYKEYIFHQYKQPVQHDYLNFVVSLFQLAFASILSPLVYVLLGFAASGDWTDLYPSSEFSKNVAEGFQCFFWVLDDEEAKSGFYDEASCGHLLSLVALYSVSVICVVVAVDKIVNGGATKVMYRGVSAGIILSVISLYMYDLHIPDFNYGAAIDSLNLVCLILLVVGSEIYHRVSLQDASFETVYPEIESFFDDIDE